MLDFLANNLSTIIVSAIVLAVVAGIVIKMIKDKKSKKSSCGCGCSGCPSAGACHPK